MVPLIFFFILIIPFHCICKPPIEELYNAHNPFNTPGLYFLSPLHGAVGAEGDFLKIIWLSNDHVNTAVYKLLKTLFIVEEGGEFLDTTYQPYCKFTPTTISILIAQAYNKKLDTSAILNAISQTFKGYKHPQRIIKLIECIQQSLQEESRGLFPTGITFQILLAFLYLQANSSNALKIYTKATYEALHLPNQETELSHNSHESMIIQKIKEKNFIPPGLPSIYWKRNITYEGHKAISDCCETAIREFFNILLYNSDTKNFDLGRLPTKLQKKLTPSIIQFYTKYIKAEKFDDVNNRENHKDWLHVVSNLPGIEYRKETYEINPCLTNIMHCIARICAIKTDTNKISSPEEFSKKICKKLSNKTFYTINVLNILHYNADATDILFQISHTRGSDLHPHHFKLHIRKDHAWIKHLSPSEPTLIAQGLAPISLDYLIAQRIEEEMQSSNTFNPALQDLAIMYTHYPTDNNELSPFLNKVDTTKI